MSVLSEILRDVAQDLERPSCLGYLRGMKWPDINLATAIEHAATSAARLHQLVRLLEGVPGFEEMLTPNLERAARRCGMTAGEMARSVESDSNQEKP